MSAPGDSLGHQVRADFPILAQEVGGRPLTYLDNAASTQSPTSVIEAVADFYRHDRANIHRAVHSLSARATKRYDEARLTVQRFIGARKREEVIFTRGTTEAINLVAHSFGDTLGPGDEILVTAMEHHSNLVPWHQLAERRGVKVRAIPMTARGELQLNGLSQGLLSERTKLVAAGHVSNAIGSINDIETLIGAAHKVGAKILIDGAQAVAHMPVDVDALGVDFYAFSGHKLLAPMGIGVLYGRHEVLRAMSPFQGGGDMIHTVSLTGYTPAELPERFEAGTPNVGAAIGLAAAIDYIEEIGFDRIRAHEEDLTRHMVERLSALRGLRLIGTPARRASVCSFVVDGIHPHDIGTALDQHGVAVRTGHHCAQPLMDFFQVPATARASVSLYNTEQDISRLVDGLMATQEFFAA